MLHTYIPHPNPCFALASCLHRQGRKRRVLPVVLRSSPCDLDCWYIEYWLKALVAVKLSRQSGRYGLYTGLIGFNPRRLKEPKKGMSSHTTKDVIYNIFAHNGPQCLCEIFFSYGRTLFRKDSVSVRSPRSDAS